MSTETKTSIVGSKTVTPKKKKATVSKITALFVFDDKRFLLEESKSKKFGCDVFKLPQIKHDPVAHGKKYNEGEMRTRVLEKYFGPTTAPKVRIIAEKKYSIDKETDFVVHFVSLNELPGPLGGEFCGRALNSVYVSWARMPGKGGGMRMILPSIVTAVEEARKLLKTNH